MLNDKCCLFVLIMWIALVIVEIATTLILGMQRGFLDGLISILIFFLLADRGLREID